MRIKEGVKDTKREGEGIERGKKETGEGEEGTEMKGTERRG